MNFAEIPPKTNKDFEENFYESGFNIEKKLKELKGPLIELAGPTVDGYELISANNLDKKIFISNRNNPAHWEKIDFMSDARKLPIKDNSVGALFVSAIGGPQHDSLEEFKELRKKMLEGKRDFGKDEKSRYTELSNIELRKLKNKTLKEASRVIENKGLLIWQAGDKEDIVFAESIGFVKKVIQNAQDRHITEIPKHRGDIYDCIFEKTLLEERK